MTLTFGSLFAGIGGFDLGFERAGMQCKWQVEIDPYCQKVLAKHWPNVRRHDDVRTFPPTDADEWRVDVICGGFPCQDISKARNGQRSRKGIDGEQSGLWWEMHRIIAALRPRFAVVENSPEIVDGWLGRICGSLVELGYDAEWKIHAAADAGAPHLRERCYLLSYPRSFGDGMASETVCSGWQSPVNSSWWASEPNVGRVANGVPKRVDRLRGLGNAVVPQIAEWIGHRLISATQERTQER